MQFHCPACQAVLTAPEDMVGDQARCAKCSTVLEIPAPATSATGVPAVADSEAREPPVSFRDAKKISTMEMDMTPMVDVTFLLLIFFMVTAAFTMQKSFEMPAPDESKTSEHIATIEDFENDPRTVVLHIDMYNTYRVVAEDWEREAPSEQELLVKLREARRPGKSGIKPTQLLIVANGEALHEKVVTALDAGSDVGMEDVKLVTVEEDG